MSRWYRAYEGTVTDAKLAEVALVAGCSRSVAIAAWHCILEAAATCNSGGAFDTTPRRVAAILGEPLAMMEAVFTEFAALSMISDGAVTSWSRRQYESDSSTERSRRHREAKRNAGATLQQQHATPPDTETDTDTEERANALSPPISPRAKIDPAGFADFWAAYPRRTAKEAARKAWASAIKRGASSEQISAAAKRYAEHPPDDPRFIPHPATWLNQGRYEDELTERAHGDRMAGNDRAASGPYREQPGWDGLQRLAADVARDGW